MMQNPGNPSSAHAMPRFIVPEQDTRGGGIRTQFGLMPIELQKDPNVIQPGTLGISEGAADKQDYWPPAEAAFLYLFPGI